MPHAARRHERAPTRRAPRNAPAPSAAVDVAPQLSFDVLSLQRLVGNQVTRGVVQGTLPAIQRELKIDSYAWSYTGIPVVQWGIMWAAGAEDLHKKLKTAFEVDLPAAVTALDLTGEEDLKKLAESLRTVHKKYDNQLLVYKKTSGKLSGEELDTELTPLLKDAKTQIPLKKQTLVTQIRNALGSVGSYMSGPLQGFRAEYDRIGTLVPKGSSGSINLPIPRLRQLATEATAYESKMQVEIEKYQTAKLTQMTTPSPSAKSKAVVKDPNAELKLYLKQQGWKELDASPILIDLSDPQLKMEVCERVFSNQVGALNQVLRKHGLTAASIHYFLFDQTIRSIIDLNAYLENLGGEVVLRKVLTSMGLDGLSTLLKRGVPPEFIAQHADQDMVTVNQQYKASIVTAPQAAKPYDPFEGVNPNTPPLQYTTLEAFLQFHTLQMQAKGVAFNLKRTYNSSYDGEHGIGGEYVPNNTDGYWVVHVHRGPNGGLKVGSIKAWNDRFILGHSQKLTVDKLTAAGIPQVDATRL
jgi:hypothetical protein